ncbi:MAG TPA: hypothetical protein VMU89_17090 [Thermomicrobiaceae bacterium]|nr:hypothetical protein [Thermomicrobiaceae bacterium]
MDTMLPGLDVRQEALLKRIVGSARAAADPDDSFVAVRVGLAGGLIYHPGSRPIAVDDLRDLQLLAERAYLALTRTRSGARLFAVTALGFEHCDRCEAERRRP